jgi:hypothetical protein
MPAGSGIDGDAGEKEGGLKGKHGR